MSPERCLISIHSHINITIEYNSNFIDTANCTASNCTNQCSQNCISNSCNIKTGTCSSCRNGWVGPKCNTSCSSKASTGCTECTQVPGSNHVTCTHCKWRHYLIDGICAPCPSNCLRCDNGTQCTRCFSGYFGPTCTKCADNCYRCMNSRQCQKCKSGYFGDQCTKCSKNCISCESETNCSKCKRGWHGASCNISCSSNCRIGCNDDGSCKRNRFCYGSSVSDPCKSGFYGRTCRCNATMTNCRLCDNVEADPCADCKPGWFGELCQVACPSDCDPVLGCTKDNGFCFRVDDNGELELRTTANSENSLINKKNKYIQYFLMMRLLM